MGRKFTGSTYRVELHGRDVEDALEEVENSLEVLHSGEYDRVSFDVGQGHHSKYHHAVLKPAVKHWLRDNDYKFYTPFYNEGIVFAEIKY